jgi:hypothetical protein
MTESIKNTQVYSLLRSTVAMLDACREKFRGERFTASRKDEIEHILFSFVNENNDPTEWEYVSHEYLYDDYLEVRKATNQLTAFDLIRPELNRSQFRNEREYYAHCLRVADRRASIPSNEASFGLKFCNGCELELPLSRFKKRGGAKCNTCRSKEYRARVAARTVADA